MSSVLHSAVDLIEFQFRADGIGLEVDAPENLPAVRADAHELIQVIVNILGNAHAELSGAAGPRRVFVRAWADGDRVYCRILDTGPGISPELRDRIFSPFFSAKQTGVGLGLTVSRHLVRASGGDLVLDENGPGASFTLWLPAHPVSQVPVAAAAPGPSIFVRSQTPDGLTGLTVLLADDEPAIRGVLERFFEREGARVITVAGGKAALEAIAQRPVDVAVLDLRMPDLDGTSVYRVIKEKHPELAPRVIFLSGDVSRVTEELDVPGNRVLVKPVELGDLRRAVAEIAARISAGQEAPT
jgi:CheY-like chemotaxis protein